LIIHFFQSLSPQMQAGTVYTLSFWHLPAQRGEKLNLRVNADFRETFSVGAAPAFSPGQPNLFQAVLPPYPSVWLNEVQPENLAGLTNGAGQRGPWVELHNLGPESVALDGYYLAPGFSNLTAWAFPAGSSIESGSFLVAWLDGATNLSRPDELHAGFAIPPGTGSLSLSHRASDDAIRILDYLNYDGIAVDRSYGSLPDGQPFFRREMFLPTPGQPNTAAALPVQVVINEWMAANSSFLANPVNGAFEDWFELYNAGSSPADLEGHFLTDDLGQSGKSPIPPGTIIPPAGHLLVWANGRPEQNSPDRLDLYADFQLSRSGELIALISPDGQIIDSVSFGPQTDDISQGRFPDGTADIFFMSTPTPRASNVLSTLPTPPDILGVRLLPGGLMVMTIAAIPGASYQVEYTDDLSNPEWLPLGPLLPASGDTLEITLAVEAIPQRFFRIAGAE